MELAQYYEPNFRDAVEDAQLDFTEILLAMRASLKEMVKFCQWKYQDCLNSENWSWINTRNSYCLQFSPPNRQVYKLGDDLHIIVGKFNFIQYFRSSP